MNYRALGRTGIRISELVFGGGWVGGILIHQDDETKLEAVRRALAAGINWIDTAPSYGDGRSEAALGWILKELDVAPHVSTKVMLDPAQRRDISGQVERSVEQSLDRLGLSKVDLLQLHNPLGGGQSCIDVGRVLEKRGVLDALERARERGLCDHIGMTALGRRQSIIEALETGRFETAQVYYNLLNPSAAWSSVPATWSGHGFSGVMAAGEQHRVGVMAIRIFASGVIATDVRHGRESALTEGTELLDEERRTRAVFAAIGDAYGSRAQTAIRYVLSHEGVACAIAGLAELDYLDEAIEGARMGGLSEGDLGPLYDLQRADFAPS